MPSNPLMATVDPGATGGVAWYDFEGLTHAEKMPETLDDMVKLFRKIENNNFGIVWYVEKVGTYMPGNSGPAAVTFARHCGHIDAALVALGCTVKYITPQKWMKAMELTKFAPFPRISLLPSLSPQEKKAATTAYDKEKSKELTRRKTIRKNEIKQFVIARYPIIKVTLKTADALGLLYWAHHNDNQMELI